METKAKTLSLMEAVKQSPVKSSVITSRGLTSSPVAIAATARNSDSIITTAIKETDANNLTIKPVDMNEIVKVATDKKDSKKSKGNYLKYLIIVILIVIAVYYFTKK